MTVLVLLKINLAEQRGTTYLILLGSDSKRGEKAKLDY